MQQVSLPGVLWVIVIIVATAMIETYQAQIIAATGIDAFWFQVGIGVLFAAAKRIELTEDQRVIFDAVIDQIKARFRVATAPQPPNMEGMRSAGPAPVDVRALAAEVEAITADAPTPPSLLQRWLLG